MQIEHMTRLGDEWDAFAESHPEVRLGHAAAWASVFSQAYGLESHYLGARDDRGTLRGILPLVLFRSRPSGPRRLISLPYLDGSGILALDREAEDELLGHALKLVSAHRFAGLDLRSSSRAHRQLDESHAMDRVNLVLRLENDSEAQWKAFRAKVRNQTRKAEREGLELMDGDGAGLLAAFYEPFRVNMRDLGSPVHARAFFRIAAQRFGDRLRLIVTQNADRPVGGLVAIRFGHRVSVPWASTLRSERKRCPNNQIYWEAIKWAIETGATEFDFGRSPRDAGTYRFKKGWGAVEEPLDWRRYDSDGSRLPQATAAPGPALEQLSRLWTRLPVPIASWLGARIRPYFSN
jgi:FemAB-related protein (PEP-CTERM system-associated)